MILCLTHSKDFYTIDIVQQALEKAGCSTLRLNADEFAVSYRFNYSLVDNSEVSLLTGDQKISTSQIQAVWYRKLWDLKIPGELDAAYHNIFAKEYNTYRQIFFNQLDH